jgi:hypothetical protein
VDVAVAAGPEAAVAADRAAAIAGRAASDKQ